MKRIVRSTILAAAALAASPAFAAPVPYAGGTYSQNFNGLSTTGSATILTRGPHDIEGQLGSTGMAGWTMSNHNGSSMDTEFRAQDGSLAGAMGRGVVSFGTAASSDRALGTLATSNQISRFGVALVNNSASTYQSFSLAFTGEQWRRGNVPSPGNSISYDYAITSDGLATINSDSLFNNLGAFTSPNTQAAPTEVALDGNLASNQVGVAAVVGGLSWQPGQTLLVRWNGQDVSGQDDALAIDNFSFSAVPEPTGIALAMLAMVGLRGLGRRR